MEKTTPPPQIIGITGKAGHGKDTSADYLIKRLRELGYRPVCHQFSKPLKRAMAELTNTTLEEIEKLKSEDATLEEFNVNIRQLGQELGDFVRSYSRKWLVTHARSEIDRLNSTSDAIKRTVHIFSDLRSPEEATGLRLQAAFDYADRHLETVLSGALILRIHRPELDNASESFRSHNTETSVDEVYADLWVENTTPTELHRELDRQIVNKYPCITQPRVPYCFETHLG